MRIRYNGAATVRIVGMYRWTEEERVAEVDDGATAADLLTQPGESFSVAEDEPLLAQLGIDRDTAARLAVAGVTRLEDAAGLSDAGVLRVAEQAYADAEQVAVWRKVASDAMRRTTTTLIEED